MSYDGFFIRDYVGQTIDKTTGTSWTNSPDIICSGTEPLQDPQFIVNADNYNEGVPQINKETPLTNNWIYIRGINPQPVPQTSTVYLYYADTSIVLWPQNWMVNGITLGGKQKNWITLEAPAVTVNQGIQGTIVPFGWTPPRVNTQYSLIAWAKNGSDQLIPPDLDNIGPIPDMGNFILAHPNIAWKNTKEVDATMPTFQGTVSIVGPSSGGTLLIGLQCQNMPTDGYIEFSVPGSDAANTIIFPKSKISKPNYSPAVQINYPATPGGFATSMNWAYYQGATPLPAGANITPFVAIPVGSENTKETNSQQLAEVLNYGSPADFAKNSQNPKVENTKVLIIGSTPFNLNRDSD